jgi:hypothetical protein
LSSKARNIKLVLNGKANECFIYMYFCFHWRLAKLMVSFCSKSCVLFKVLKDLLGCLKGPNSWGNKINPRVLWNGLYLYSMVLMQVSLRLANIPLPCWYLDNTSVIIFNFIKLRGLMKSSLMSKVLSVYIFYMLTFLLNCEEMYIWLYWSLYELVLFTKW